MAALFRAEARYRRAYRFYLTYERTLSGIRALRRAYRAKSR